ncbi:hypothetical protein SAMN05216436_13332 [bacterium A37T11]|nr:hypothetical protein SAMN05216436_13332 [bacterium A37T11]
MRTERVLTNYSKISDADLSTLAGKTLTAITGNVHLPDPIPTVRARYGRGQGDWSEPISGVTK